MKSLYLSLVIGDNFSPLELYRQLSVAFAKAAGKDKVIKAELIGWPFLLVRNESGGYYIFDETRRLSTRLELYILQDYDKLLSSIENLKSDTEVLNYLNNIRWGDYRGSTSISLEGLVSDDLKDLLKVPPNNFSIKIIPKTLTNIDVELVLADLQKISKQIKENVDKINKIKEKIEVEINIIKGKKAEEKKRTEDKYDTEIRNKETQLQEELTNAKKSVENEIKAQASQLYSKMADMEAIIAKAELDKEAGRIDTVNSVMLMKNQYLNEINNKLAEIREKYKVNIRKLREEINNLHNLKKNEVDRLNKEIEALDNMKLQILSQLDKVRNDQLQLLNRLEGLSKKLTYSDDMLEVIIPFMVVYTARGRVVISPQIYKGGKKSLFGLLKKDPAEISEQISGAEVLVNLIDVEGEPLDKYKSLIDQGLKELSDEGWGVRKSYEEYFR